MSELYQYSHFWAVTNGCYDGDLTIKELKKKGNMGLGTFNALDGELVIINNCYYHCSNGVVREAKDEEKLPWAAVATLCRENSFNINEVSSLNQLQSIITDKISTINYPVSLYIKANLENISLGSVPKQHKPYRPIAEVIRESTLIDTGKIQVEMVGFYAPDFMFPIKSNGIHLHFTDIDRKIGGHVLDLKMYSATIFWQELHAVRLILPKHSDYNKSNLSITHNERVPLFTDRLEK